MARAVVAGPPTAHARPLGPHQVHADKDQYDYDRDERHGAALPHQQMPRKPKQEATDRPERRRTVIFQNRLWRDILK